MWPLNRRAQCNGTEDPEAESFRERIRELV
jgi:hypothetical protein